MRTQSSSGKSESEELGTEKMRKVYRALIGPADRTALPDRFVCEYSIGKIPYPQMSYVYGCAEGGLYARSEGRVLARRSNSTLVEVSIATGRPHQIRIHLAAMGYPLLGDPLYEIGGVPKAAGEAIPSDCGYQLHAHQLVFEHPRTGKRLSIIAEPSADLSM